MSKTLILALAATLGTATLASAETSYIALQSEHSASTLLNFDLVRSAEAGSIVVTDFAGNVLGTSMINAGANTDVKVSLTRIPNSDLVATIQSTDGSVLSQDRVNIDRM